MRSLLVVVALAAPARADDEVAWPATVDIPERGASPFYFRAEPSIAMLALRGSAKALVRMAGEGGGDRLGYGFDLHVAGRFGLGRGRTVGLWPELGYVYTDRDGHLASLGFGIAAQTPRLGDSLWSGLSLGLVPHVLIGDGTRGLRTSALAELYLDDGNAWGVELAHQLTERDGMTAHELTLGISLTLGVRRWR